MNDSCDLHPRITGWRFSSRSIATRLFFTCWLVYSLHFATNIVREIYLGLAIGDHLSFRVDEYANLHDDIFEKEGFGWHIGSNPGASMLAAIPYAIFRPGIDLIVERVQKWRSTSSQINPPFYNTPIDKDRIFFEEAWNRGFDIKFGLAAFIMQAFCMAPISALGVIFMFFLLRAIFRCDKTALLLAILYAFGTPVFFRTGFLNHNMMLGHIAFMGFIVLWNPGASLQFSTPTRFLLGGLAAGTTVLFDYSGIVLLFGMFCYGLLKDASRSSKLDALKRSLWFVLGSLGPVGLLWFYQWQSFGHPFYPAQHWMPLVEWIDEGYQGVDWPQFQLFLALGFDYRYGLFVSSPLMLFALLSPFFNRDEDNRLPWLELTFVLTIFFAFWIFFSGVNYTRWQFNTGVRYLAPMLPFLFVLAALALIHLPRGITYGIAILSVAQAWCMAMYRDVAAGQVEIHEVKAGLGVLDPLLQVFSNGLQLPALTTLSLMQGPFTEFLTGGASPLPLFLFTAALLWVIWHPGKNSEPA